MENKKSVLDVPLLVTKQINLHTIVLHYLYYINPYTLIVHFVGHMQTEVNKIRRHRTQHLNKVSTVCLQSNLFKFVMVSLSDTNQTDSIEAFNSTSRYLDDLLKISSLDFYLEAITHEILQHTQKYKYH